MDLNGTFTLLHAFDTFETFGLKSSLMEANDGNFYGQTQNGNGPNKGAVFRLTPSGDLSVLHTFVGADVLTAWAGEPGGLVQGSDGHLYGTRTEGGDYDLGVVFRVVLPAAQDSALTVVEDTASQDTLIATDPNNGPLTFSIVSNGLLGTATINDSATGAFTYTPIPNATGTDSFTFKANNGTVDTNIATISVTITAVNDRPVAQTGSLETDEDTTAAGVLVATDVDSAGLTYSIVTNGTKGTAAVTNPATGAFTYAPNANANGSDTFTFTVADGELESGETSVTVTITAVNDAPVAASAAASTTPGVPVEGTLTATDVDSATLTYAIVTNGTKGTAVITNIATGAYTYTPQVGESGIDTFTFNANDGSLDSNVATITVSIAGNAPPIASNGTLTTREDRSASGRLIASDPESQPLVFSVVTPPTKGTVTVTNAATGRFTYVPQVNANGADSFTFKASDGGADSNVATISVTITAVNDAPVAESGSVTTQVNQAIIGTLQASDADGDALTFSVARTARRGTVVINPDGGFTYTPSPGFTGNDAFRFRVTDSAGASVLGTISITVN